MADDGAWSDSGERVEDAGDWVSRSGRVENSGDSSPMTWLICGVLLGIVGAVIAVLASGVLAHLGLIVTGLGGIAATVGATGHGVLLALRQHRRETGGI